MALKFLNKKGWHTGSLRNIENVWKAEQKQEAEQAKLEELKKQIHEERERAEFRLLQEQAGLVPKQERLEFLYDSGLSVGRSSSSGGFKELESYPKPPDSQTAAGSSSSSAKQQASAPGALFEDKPQSANDAWRKLHSDPLLLIRKREQEALARVKNNPVQMAMIRKSVEAVKDKKETKHKKEHKTKHHHKKSKHRKHSSSKNHSDSDGASSDEDERKLKGRKGLDSDDSSYRRPRDSDAQFNEDDLRRKRTTYKDLKHKDGHRDAPYDGKSNKREDSYKHKRDLEDSHRRVYHSKGQTESDYAMKDREERSFAQKNHLDSSDTGARRESNNRRRGPVKLSEEERAARLREMQIDAELHEEQRWKRLKKAEEKDVQEAMQANPSGGRSFLDAAHEKGGNTTIEESVRRRKYYSQGRSEATERNAFRR